MREVRRAGVVRSRIGLTPRWYNLHINRKLLGPVLNNWVMGSCGKGRQCSSSAGITAMDLEAIREEFAITRNYNFMNHASVAPIPRCTVKAVQAYLQQQHDNSYVGGYGNKVEQVRAAAGELINATPNEIAFVKSTAEGISFVANGLKWNAGDNIVTSAVEFPSNMSPWMNVQSRGAQIRTVLEENGRIPLENIIEAIDSRTRVVTISAVQFASGFRSDLIELGRWCQKRGVLFCVDAIQALGVLPIDVREMKIDFLSCGGHKWLCAPEGTGIFYCNRELSGHLRPSTVAWRSVKRGADFLRYDLTFHDDARRFEASAYNIAGIYGLGASIELLRKVGIDNISRHVLSLTDRLVEGVREKGYRVISAREEGAASGIVAFTSPTHDHDQIGQHLEREHRIIIAVRSGRLRVSPHLYNTTEEIDRLIDVLPKH